MRVQHFVILYLTCWRTGLKSQPLLSRANMPVPPVNEDGKHSRVSEIEQQPRELHWRTCKKRSDITG